MNTQRHHITGLLALCTALATAQEAAVPVYETAPVLSAGRLLKPKIRKGPLHEVLDPVPTKGLANQYTLVSRHGTWRVRSNDVLVKRINEIYAIARLEEVSKSEEFQEALKTAAAKPFRFVGHVITEPVETISGIGSGAARYIRRAGEAIQRGGRKSAQQDSTLEQMVGFSKAKRELAFHLKVDPYTDNEVLKKRLDETAWASFSGGFLVKAGTIAIGGTTGAIAGGVSASATVEASLRDNSPLDLSNSNRRALANIGIGESNATAFIEHPSISPTNQTIITDLLVRLNGVGGRDTFVGMMNSSRDLSDVLFWQRTAQLMVLYHEKVSPVRQILNLHGLSAIHAGNDALVIPLAVDYGSWTEDTDRLSLAIKNYKPQVNISSRVLYMTGALSPEARRELKARGFQVSDNANSWIYR